MKQEIVVLLFFIFNQIYGQYPVTHSSAISQGYFLPGQEFELLSVDGAGVLSYFWTTEAADDSVNADTIFRYYVDDDNPMEFTLDMLAGVGFEDPQAPWGNSYFGKGAATGGVYSTLRVPYTKSFRITGEVPSYSKSGITFWWISRIVTNLPIVIGGYTLPSNAKLNFYKNQDTILKPLEYLPLVETKSNGAVWMVALAVESKNLNYLEGCVRMYLQGSKSPELLSSGTEDYFQSAFYFNAGEFHLPEAGFTHANSTDGSLSAYKVHDRDALFFSSGGFTMTWRNGDYQDLTTGRKCVNHGSPNGNPQQSVVTSYAWVYEW